MPLQIDAVRIYQELPRRLIALDRALKNAPALVDVVTSQTVISSDAQKGLGFVPELSGAHAWDEAEQKRRGEEIATTLAKADPKPRQTLVEPEISR